MSHRLKLLCTAALCASLFASCSQNNAQVEPEPPVVEATVETPSPTQDVTVETPSLDAKTAAMEAKKLAEEKQAMIKAEAEAQAAAEEAKAAKDAMARAEAQAQAAKNAADAKAAKEAMALAEQEQQAAIERQAVIERQAALEAQRVADAKALREAELARQVQATTTSEVVSPEPQTVTHDIAPVQTPTITANPNAPYNAFLSKYVSSVNGINLVAYDKVTPEDRAKLRAYIEALSAKDIEALPRDQEMAAWFNLYNAKTIELILENYPTKSIRKISRPWKKDRLTVNGKPMSLDDIEHGTVRRKYDEPRVHYAFNCASIGCPNVKASAWEAATLEADLAQAARDFIASERGVSIQGDKIVASSIFKWYKKDFGGNEAGILAHMREYATGSKKAVLDSADNINKYDYDWDLNIR